MMNLEMNEGMNIMPIKEILNRYKINDNDIILYGNNMAKVNVNNPKKNGKLILVTSTNPTPYGEGKTTLAIGLCDALNYYGYLSALALREPSLGPVFGTKGGATGGGLCQIYPMDKINLHFTGDFHAITSANNLIAAVIDDHIYHGNTLDIKNIYFQRCIDMNDRSLRDIKVGDNTLHFTITAASEMMSAFCLASDFADLRSRIDNMIVGSTSTGKYVLVKDLDCTGAVLSLLKEAFIPNAVATLNNNLAFVHGGPFANIAHGCNSVQATHAALSVADYVITEAGFGSDCGALKFLDIKCRQNNIYPDLIVINSTVRSLKYNGDGILENGIENLEFHIKNMQKFHDNVLVIINKFEDDKDEEIDFIINFCNNLGVEALVSNMYLNGTKDTLDIASKVVELANKKNHKYFNAYDLTDSLQSKIDKMCKLFGAREVIYNDNILEKIKEIDKNYPDYYICISKTPSSITDDKNILGYPKDFKMTVTDIKVNAGGRFITVLMGDVITLPGLSKKANYHNIDVINDKIVGLS